MPGKFMRGALVEFMDAFLVPVPNVIIFQYNPETMTHTWTQPEAAPSTGPRTNPLAVRGTPGEAFQFTIAVDANDMIADGLPPEQVLAATTGVYSRLAALEMLQYPINPSGQGGLLGSVSVSVSVSVGSSGFSLNASAGAQTSRSIPQAQIPAVLFIWGAGRIVPVRVTSLSITEQLYDASLNPIHAQAALGLRVLTPEELEFVPGAMGTIANAAYTYSQGLRQALAVANLANAADSILGMLPIG